MMTSTYAVQSIPPYDPTKRLKTDPSSCKPSQALPPFSSLAHMPLPSSAIVNSADSSVRRISATSTGASSAPSYPSVFDIPNPNKHSNANSESVFRDDTNPSAAQVHTRDTISEKSMNGKRRRGIDDAEGNSRRESVDSSNGATPSTVGHGEPNANGIRASFSFPANPHPPYPGYRPYPLLSGASSSSSSTTAPPLRTSPALGSVVDSAQLESSDHSSPTATGAKRARTSFLGSLESLAATASDILSSGSNSSSPVSVTSTSASTPPDPSITSLIGPPSETHSREHRASLENSRQLKEEQAKEIERRRVASGGLPSDQPAVGSAQAALDRLRGGVTPRATPSVTPHDDAALKIEKVRNEGLAKRRGHRPPAVTTTSFPPSNQTLAIGSARSHEEVMRGAPRGMPSVLIGSPIEATWAAQMAKEATTGLARGEALGGKATNATSRRQSMNVSSTGVPSHPLFPTTLPPRGSAHPGHSRSSGSAALSPQPQNSVQQQSTQSHTKQDNQPRDRPKQQQRPIHAPGGNSSWRPVPSPPHSHTRSHSHSHSHSYLPHANYHSSQPLLHTHSHERDQANGTRLPPLNLMNLRTGNNVGALSAHVSPPYPPHAQSNPHSYLPSHAGVAQPPPTPQSASKSAFLSLFSTFFDSLQDSKVLTSTLEGQISRAGTLLTTLQQSEQALEHLVDRKLARVLHNWDERQARVEHEFVSRLERLEQQVLVQGGTEGDVGPVTARRDRSPSPPFETRRLKGGRTREDGGETRGVGLGITEQPLFEPSSSSSILDERLRRLEKWAFSRESRRSNDQDLVVMMEEDGVVVDKSSTKRSTTTREHDDRGSLPTPQEEEEQNEQDEQATRGREPEEGDGFGSNGPPPLRRPHYKKSSWAA